MTGKEKHDIPIQDAVEPFVVVKGKKRRWFEETEMGDENSTVRTRKKRGRKGKKKGKAKEVREQDADMEEAGDDGTPVPVDVGDSLEGGPQESIRPEVEELVLAIHKINSFETPRGKHLVFSAVGYVPYPPSLCLVYRLYPISKLYISVCLCFPFTRRYTVSHDSVFRLFQARNRFLHPRSALLGSGRQWLG